MRTKAKVSAAAASNVAPNQVTSGEFRKHPEDCKECAKLAEAYEAATISFFRVQNQFYIASLSGDLNALCKLAAEMDQVADRRVALKTAEMNHLALARAQSAGQ